MSASSYLGRTPTAPRAGARTYSGCCLCRRIALFRQMLPAGRTFLKNLHLLAAERSGGRQTALAARAWISPACLFAQTVRKRNPRLICHSVTQPQQDIRANERGATRQKDMGNLAGPPANTAHALFQ